MSKIGKLQLKLLGHLQVTYGAVTLTPRLRPRAQRLLAYLLLHRVAPRTRDSIAFTLWPDGSEKEALGADDIETVKKLREIYKGNNLESQVLHEAERLDGSVRNTGIHAAGIIIAPKDLTELIPVCTAKDSSLWVTQIEGSIIEDAGVIKMDFLGLKTLTIIKNALRLIKENHGLEIDIDTIPLDDKKTFELYQHGDTIGTFQFESPGMQKYLRDLKPDQFADLIAMNALYRPGPLSGTPHRHNR